MSKSNAFETALLELVFNNQAIAGIGDAGGLQPSVADGNLYVALHTADPGEAGSQTTSECSYTGYARVAVPRDGSGWTVTNNQVVPQAAIAFPEREDSGASQTATYFSIGTASSGAGMVLYRGQITTPSGGIVITEAVTPQLTTATNVTED